MCLLFYFLSRSEPLSLSKGMMLMWQVQFEMQCNAIETTDNHRRRTDAKHSKESKAP